MNRSKHPRNNSALFRLVKQASERLHRDDAGLFRLRKALRTVGAIGLAVLLVAGIQHFFETMHGILPLAVSGTVCMQMMLLTMGPTRHTQMKIMTAATLFMMLESLLLYHTHDQPLISQTALPLLAFGAFYIRRFGAEYIGLGLMMLFSYMILSFLLQPGLDISHILYAILIAFCAAFSVNFFVLPDDPQTAYSEAVEQFLESAANSILDLSRTLSSHPQPSFPEQNIKQLRLASEKCDTLSAYLPLSGPPENASLRMLVFRLFGTLLMLSEGLRDSQKLNHPLAAHLAAELRDTLESLANLLFHLAATLNRNEDVLSEELDAFTQKAAACFTLVETNQAIIHARLFPLARTAFALKRTAFALERRIHG